MATVLTMMRISKKKQKKKTKCLFMPRAFFYLEFFMAHILPKNIQEKKPSNHNYHDYIFHLKILYTPLE